MVLRDMRDYVSWIQMGVFIGLVTLGDEGKGYMIGLGVNSNLNVSIRPKSMPNIYGKPPYFLALKNFPAGEKYAALFIKYAGYRLFQPLTQKPKL